MPANGRWDLTRRLKGSNDDTLGKKIYVSRYTYSDDTFQDSAVLPYL